MYIYILYLYNTLKYVDTVTNHIGFRARTLMTGSPPHRDWDFDNASTMK